MEMGGLDNDEIALRRLSTSMGKVIKCDVGLSNVVLHLRYVVLKTREALIGGNEFPQAAARIDDGGWKLACALVAILAFIATVSSMFKKQAG
jgi:hypothetical protein